MGAYYTQEDITEYIYLETYPSNCPFLFDALPKAKCKVAFENPAGRPSGITCAMIPTAISTPLQGMALNTRFHPRLRSASRTFRLERNGTRRRSPTSACPPRSGARSWRGAHAMRNCAQNWRWHSPRDQRSHHLQPRYSPVRPGRSATTMRAIIGWDAFRKRNQRLINATTPTARSWASRGAVRRGGEALLAGLFRLAAYCGRKLHVAYQRDQGRRRALSLPRSLDQPRRGALHAPSALSLRVDSAVAAEVIERIQPLGVEGVAGGSAGARARRRRESAQADRTGGRAGAFRNAAYARAAV